ncbi:DUF3226 domain-containing protein [Pedobacter jeongneungensis]|uniref:DUF3226 domain-containing protein n=1 Tax=Pedobacter jeongneungensis TaxID=947309 RepID=UPI000468AE10|nr:DUF3226 domain-containing protein [Pedobacter jeongneungensis]
MMLNIFCEGIGDQLFIADFIESHFPIILERTYEKFNNDKVLVIKNATIEIIPINGCKQINKLVIKDLFVNNTERGGKNLLIFDADYTGINGNNGFTNCNTMIENLKKHPTQPIEFIHFLWPDNKNDGLFENLLEKLIPNDKIEIVRCIESNLECLTVLKHIHDIKVPGIKEKISSYLHLFSQSTKVMDRSYKSIFWNLSLENCNELLDLKIFFEQNLPKPY